MRTELTDRDLRLAALQLEWSRSLEQHGLGWEAWLIQKAVSLSPKDSAPPRPEEVDRLAA